MKKVFDQYSKFYDEIYKQKKYALEAIFVNEVLKKYANQPKNILSMGCGTCNHELHLVKNGYSITGLDQSQTMLNIAKNKITQAHLENKISLIKGDATHFKLNNKFDVVMELFNVFGYHTKNKEVNNVLKNCNQSLKKDGILLFDCWYLPAVLYDKPKDIIKEIKTDKGRLFRITQSKLHTDKNVIEIKFHILSINKKTIVGESEEIHFMRYWSLPELKNILLLNGFKLIKTCNFLDLKSTPSEDNWDIFVIAKKIV